MSIREALEKLFVLAVNNKIGIYEGSYEQAYDIVVTELDKQETLIKTMQSEFDRLEGIEDNTAMLKLELEKKDKVIDEMAEKLVEAHGWFYSEFNNYTKEDWKEYFTRK